MHFEINQGGGVQHLTDLLVVDKMRLYYSDDIIINPAHARICMKTSSVLEMQHFLGYQIKVN